MGPARAETAAAGTAVAPVKAMDDKAVPTLSEQINQAMQEYLAQDQAIRAAEQRDMQALSVNNGTIEQQQAVIDRYRVQLNGLTIKMQATMKSLHDQMQDAARARLKGSVTP